MVIACGGDGTFNEIVNGLAGSQVPLALLPAGTANVLAKELALPWNIGAGGGAGGRQPPPPDRAGPSNIPAMGTPPRHFVSVGGAGPDGAIVQALDLGLEKRGPEFWPTGPRASSNSRLTVSRNFGSRRAGGKPSRAHLSSWGERNTTAARSRSHTEADLYSDEFEVMLSTERQPVPLRDLYRGCLCLRSLRGQPSDLKFLKATEHLLRTPGRRRRSTCRWMANPLGACPPSFRHTCRMRSLWPYPPAASTKIAKRSKGCGRRQRFPGQRQAGSCTR